MILNVLFAAAAAVTTPPPPAPARPIAWPAVSESKLDNGLTVVLAPLHNVPKVTFELDILSGRTPNGVAQLAGRVATEGTATRSSKEIKE